MFDLTQIILHKQANYGSQIRKQLGCKWLGKRGLASVACKRVANMFDMAGQFYKSWPIKHENKRNALSCLIECLMAFNLFFNETRPNTIK